MRPYSKNQVYRFLITFNGQQLTVGPYEGYNVDGCVTAMLREYPNADIIKMIYVSG